MKISSVTRPAIPEALLAEMHKAPMRKPFSHPEAGEIGSLSEFLEQIADDGTATISAPLSLCADIVRDLSQLIERGELVAAPEEVTCLAHEVTWSIFHGQLGQNVGFQSESHMMNAAIKLILQKKWTRPNGYPQDYLAQAQSDVDDTPKGHIEF